MSQRRPLHRLKGKHDEWRSDVSTLFSTVGESGFPDHARAGAGPGELPAGRRFQIDPARSRIGFAVRHFRIVTVRGRFTDYSGEVILEGDDPARAHVSLTVRTASIDTGRRIRDRHLRSFQFLNSRKYPVMSFVSGKVEAEGRDSYRMTGDLTIKDVARPVTLEVGVPEGAGDPRGNDPVMVTGTGTIAPSDWKMALYRVLERLRFVVDRQVALEIEAAIVPAGEAPGQTRRLRGAEPPRSPAEAGRPDWLPVETWPFQIRSVVAAGCRVRYVDEGSGPILVFVHAGPAWSFIYRDVITRLRSQFRCIALDFPGSGLSEAPPGYRAGIESASEVFEAFLQALDLHDVTLVVHDLGGPVAIGAAAGMPDRVVALAVTDSFGWPLSEENPGITRMLRIVGSRPVRLLNEAANVVARVTATTYGAGRRFTATDRRAFLGPYRDRSVRRNALAMLGDAARAVEYLRGVDRSLRTTLADRPVLLVFGGGSPTVKEGFPERWKERFPRAPLEVIEGGHHFPMADDPDTVADAVRSWREESPDGGGVR
jgi:polyisoprenoid-binding protein YceI/pimeloyl-ACP methyl ester carboxylesterase